MTPGLYTAATTMTARAKAHELIAQNLASASTNGYRRLEPQFDGFGSELYTAQQDAAPATAAGVKLMQPVWNHGHGIMKETGRDLDLALGGEGFFVLETPLGARLTRDGHFMRDKDGRLVSSAGDTVSGVSGAIILPDGEVSVKDDGSIFVDGNEVGRLKIETADDLRGLDSAGGGLFRVLDQAGVRPAKDPGMVNRVIEMSNVEIPIEMVTMIENSRMYEAAQKALQMTDANIGTTIQNLLAP
jgi:flagellar basal-body rod protein FlgG